MTTERLPSIAIVGCGCCQPGQRQWPIHEATRNRETRRVLDHVSSDLTLTTAQRHHRLERHCSPAPDQWMCEHIGSGLLPLRQETSVPSRRDPQHLERFKRWLHRSGYVSGAIELLNAESSRVPAKTKMSWWQLSLGKEIESHS